MSRENKERLIAANTFWVWGLGVWTWNMTLSKYVIHIIHNGRYDIKWYNISGQIIIFHQPGFPWNNKEISLTIHHHLGGPKLVWGRYDLTKIYDMFPTFDFNKSQPSSSGSRFSVKFFPWVSNEEPPKNPNQKHIARMQLVHQSSNGNEVFPRFHKILSHMLNTVGKFNPFETVSVNLNHFPIVGMKTKIFQLSPPCWIPVKLMKTKSNHLVVLG